MPRIMLALLIGLGAALWAGCGDDTEKPEEPGAGELKQGDQVKPGEASATDPAEGMTGATQPKGPPEKPDPDKFGPRPHHGTLNMTQNDLDRIKRAREERQKDFDRDR